MFWPGIGELKAVDLVRSHLLERAVEGLRSWGVDADDAGRLGSIIDRRCAGGATASAWWVDRVEAQTRSGDSLERALIGATADYRGHMHDNTPIAEWDRG